MMSRQKIALVNREYKMGIISLMYSSFQKKKRKKYTRLYSRTVYNKNTTKISLESKVTTDEKSIFYNNMIVAFKIVFY